ncbi:pleckstrin homology domain-containing family N member 1 isoform X3 [Pipistrellus kuhlii]|uniref:pleckstrin homology domain-containing family N member 1 isoform X3 n=1 Tax=Pipistrellus kuhlii TaxID=59472 RepID=UPI001E27175F|nr:pleckstrin homology domain-containing family N member 1 isoform X3 [Pipistrellus kuhlii]
MGNSHCVPQASRRLRASFSRKPSLKGSREDGTRKLAGLFGSEASPDDGDTAADKIFCYIPGTDLPGLESQQEHLDQPFLSVFKKGRRRVPVRNLGKVVHYAKDVSDCYLELFPSHLYFQAHGSEGFTFQGLLPLVELSICPMEGSREHAFQITGPLPAPLLVVCPSQAELGRWLYHLEKQMALLRGLQCCHSAPPQAPPEDQLPWSLQHRLTQLRTAWGRQAVGSAICASRVKLQHLPSQERWDRILVLYSTSLAIFSEEADGLCFKGELPLSAIHINLEEKEKQIRSFLIEGPLINTIRVLCASYEDYSHWLLCLQTISHREGAPLLPGPEGFPGLRASPQVLGSGRGSLSSDGQTSWDSGYPAPHSNRTSRSLPECSVPSRAGCPAQPVSSCFPQDQANPGWTSVSGQKAELRRGGSSRSPRSKARGERPGPATPLHLDLTKLTRPSLEGGPETSDHSLETPHSPLYADPYTPPATSHHKVRDVRGLGEFLAAVKSSLGPEPSSPFPSVPVSVPLSGPSSGVAGPHLLSRKGVLQPRASQRHRGSIGGRGARPPDSPQLMADPPGALTKSGTRLHLPPASGGPEKHLRLRGDSRSGSEPLLRPTCQCRLGGGSPARPGLSLWGLQPTTSTR